MTLVKMQSPLCKVTSEMKKSITKNGEEVTLYRVVAKQDYPPYLLKKGEIGGWIDENSAIEGNVWIERNGNIINSAVSGELVIEGTLDNSTINYSGIDKAFIIGHISNSRIEANEELLIELDKDGIVENSKIEGESIQIKGKSNIQDCQIKVKKMTMNHQVIIKNVSTHGDGILDKLECYKHSLMNEVKIIVKETEHELIRSVIALRNFAAIQCSTIRFDKKHNYSLKVESLKVDIRDNVEISNSDLVNPKVKLTMSSKLSNFKNNEKIVMENRGGHFVANDVHLDVHTIEIFAWGTLLSTDIRDMKVLNIGRKESPNDCLIHLNNVHMKDVCKLVMNGNTSIEDTNCKDITHIELFSQASLKKCDCNRLQQINLQGQSSIIQSTLIGNIPNTIIRLFDFASIINSYINKNIVLSEFVVVQSFDDGKTKRTKERYQFDNVLES